VILNKEIKDLEQQREIAQTALNIALAALTAAAALGWLTLGAATAIASLAVALAKIRLNSLTSQLQRKKSDFSKKEIQLTNEVAKHKNLENIKSNKESKKQEYITKKVARENDLKEFEILKQKNETELKSKQKNIE